MVWAMLSSLTCGCLCFDFQAGGKKAKRKRNSTGRALHSIKPTQVKENPLIMVYDA